MTAKATQRNSVSKTNKQINKQTPNKQQQEQRVMKEHIVVQQSSHQRQLIPTYIQKARIANPFHSDL